MEPSPSVPAMTDDIYDTPIDQLDVGTGTETTATPGIYYHGSRHIDLAELESEATVKGVGRIGTFFTHFPSYAALYPAWHLGTCGRVYRVEITTRNPLYSGDFPKGREAGNRQISDAIAQGFDCIVRRVDSGATWELITFDRSQIAYKSRIGKPAAIAEVALESGVFFFNDSIARPDFAPDCIPIFSAPGRANGPGAPRAVAVETRNAIYCDRDAWSRMTFAYLRNLAVDCLIDPETGDALLIDPALMRPINWVELRKRRSRLRKNEKSVKRDQLAKMLATAANQQQAVSEFSDLT